MEQPKFLSSAKTKINTLACATWDPQRSSHVNPLVKTSSWYLDDLYARQRSFPTMQPATTSTKTLPTDALSISERIAHAKLVYRIDFFTTRRPTSSAHSPTRSPCLIRHGIVHCNPDNTRASSRIVMSEPCNLVLRQTRRRRFPYPKANCLHEWGIKNISQYPWPHLVSSTRPQTCCMCSVPLLSSFTQSNVCNHLQSKLWH